MDRDDLEFLISQYVDGTLVGGKREAMEARLKLDPAARAVLAEYRALDAQLKSLPRLDVRWDAFAEQVSAAVAEAEEPAQSYRLSDYRWANLVRGRRRGAHRRRHGVCRDSQRRFAHPQVNRHRQPGTRDRRHCY